MQESEIERAEEPSKRGGQFSRWSGVVLMIAILCFAGILSALTAMRFAICGREVAVPSFVGKTEDQAAEILAGNSRRLKDSSKRSSSVIPDADVLEQIPPRGPHLK